MLANLKARRDSEEGFTLIELMVVVLIIAILIAIAIPTFLGARERAQERAAQSSDRNALTAAKTLFTDQENYDATDAVALAAVEPSLTFFDSVDVSDTLAMGVGTSPNNISVTTADTNADTVADQITLSARANNGQCFSIREDTLGATAGTTFASWDSGGGVGCNSAAPGGAYGTAW